MRLVKTRPCVVRLQAILCYIALDNPPAALSFERELQAKLELVKNQPFMCRPFHYLKHEAYRDLIHQGYRIIYKVEQGALLLLDIFKWQQR
ncbi:type II toxin-antitoxin system RelE/ParE family toxin [Thiomicrospira cyclica]|uniref:Plasmid stabilization system n=1 Tax=Thiomicrospira cyclica (strain DSM 14477 / JCM 11371 / ALM1) TaxID=717773 RepID=F6DCN2_THICA|nr:type II toxin-antitoxin system RelE/ParE family toxin [Thiomicrospira cyclica]AEG31618.1 plasmid stabilization system [Thiomicrospira cyclica ALM1]